MPAQHFWRRGVVLSLSLVIVLLPLLTLPGGGVLVYPWASSTMLLLWLCSLGIILLTELLTLPTDAAQARSYALFAATTLWLTQGLTVALWSLLLGFLLAGALRKRPEVRQNILPEHFTPNTPRFLSRLVLAATPLLMMGLVANTLGLLLPLKQADFDIILLLTATITGVITLAALAWALGGTLRQRYIADVSAAITYGTLATLMLDQIGVLGFVLLYVLVLFQLGRQYQVSTVQENLTRRIRELSLLNGSADGVSGSLDVDEIVTGMMNWVRQLADVPVFYTVLNDDERITHRYLFEEGTPQSDTGYTDNPLTSAVLRSKKVSFVDRTHDRLYSPLFANLPEDQRYRHALGIPLMVGQKCIGMIALVTSQGSNLLGRTELRTLETIAKQAGLSIHNAMLYQQKARLVDNLTKVNRSVQDVMFNLDEKSALESALKTAVDITQADKAAVFLVDQQRKREMHLAYALNLTDTHRNLYNGPIHRPEVRFGEPRIITDTLEVDNRDAITELAKLGGFRALAETPLRSGGATIGLLTVFHEAPHYYDDTERELLGTLANQMTAALDYTELLGALELYAAEQTQLVHLSRISIASLEIDKVVAGVADIIKEMMPVDKVAIGFSEGNNIRIYQPNHDTDADTTIQTLPLNTIPELDNWFKHQQPGPRIYYRSDSLSTALTALMDQHGPETLTFTPLITNNTLLGVVFLGCDAAYTFSDNEWRLMEMITNQFAANILNAQQHSNTEAALNRRLQQLALIEEVAQQISSSLSLEPLIDNVLRAAVMATQAGTATLGLLNEDGKLRIFTQELLKERWLKSEVVRNSADGVMGRVIRDRKPRNLAYNRQSPHYVALHSYHRIYQSSLTVPLIIEDTVIGVLGVESEMPDFFDEERIQFIQSLAGHAVISIQNARLLNARQMQIETLTKLRDLSLRLSGDTNIITVGRAIAQTAVSVLNGNYASLFQIYENGRRENLGSYWDNVRGSFSGGTLLGEPIPGHRKRLNFYIPDALVEQAIHTGDVQFIEDVHQHELFRASQPQGFKSLIIIPIKHGNVVEEILAVSLATPPLYRDMLMNSVELLAIQAAGHISHAMLYERIRSDSIKTRAIMESTRDGVILLDRTGKLIEANPRAEDLLGMSLDDYIEEDFAEALIQRLEGEAETSNSVQEALKHTARILRLEPQRITSRSVEIHRDGKITYIDEIGSPVYDNNTGQITGRLLTFRDVTEERQVEVFRDEITNMVVHDLRGPLSSIISGISVANDILSTMPASIDVEQLNALLDVTNDSAEYLMKLVDSLLDIARLESNRMPLVRENASVKSLVHNAFITLFSAAEQAQITIEQNVADDLPQVDIDVEKIQRVLVNLLDNAISYTPRGGRVMISAASAGTRKVIVRIADSGPGIPDEEAERIFEKFRQIKGNISNSGRKGSGLGLTFCKLVIEAHGEAIWVEQNGPLPGACFALTLPVATGDKPTIEQPQLEASIEQT